jgi:hypothetical protein
MWRCAGRQKSAPAGDEQLSRFNLAAVRGELRMMIELK